MWRISNYSGAPLLFLKYWSNYKSFNNYNDIITPQYYKNNNKTPYLQYILTFPFSSSSINSIYIPQKNQSIHYLQPTNSQIPNLLVYKDRDSHLKYKLKATRRRLVHITSSFSIQQYQFQLATGPQLSISTLHFCKESKKF